jgi:hypothetical protein
LRKFIHKILGSLILMGIGNLFAQNAPITEPQLMYTQSNLMGVNLNSFKSWGLFYRYGWHKTGKQQSHLEIDFNRIKHPKEVRRQGYSESQSQYSFGRLNAVFFLRTSLGQTIAITERPYKNAIGLNFVYSLGASVAFLKPVYIDYYYPYDNTPGQGYLVSERYDPEKHTDIYRIFGNSAFTKGMGETQLKLGGFGRGGFQVEWGQYSDEIRCLEAGVTLDLFSSGIPIMAHQNNSQLFYGFYVSYNWGNRK